MFYGTRVYPVFAIPPLCFSVFFGASLIITPIVSLVLLSQTAVLTYVTLLLLVIKIIVSRCLVYRNQ